MYYSLPLKNPLTNKKKKKALSSLVFWESEGREVVRHSDNLRKYEKQISKELQGQNISCLLFVSYCSKKQASLSSFEKAA